MCQLYITISWAYIWVFQNTHIQKCLEYETEGLECTRKSMIVFSLVWLYLLEKQNAIHQKCIFHVECTLHDKNDWDFSPLDQLLHNGRRVGWVTCRHNKDEKTVRKIAVMQWSIIKQTFFNMWCAFWAYFSAVVRPGCGLLKVVSSFMFWEWHIRIQYMSLLVWVIRWHIRKWTYLNMEQVVWAFV